MNSNITYNSSPRSCNSSPEFPWAFFCVMIHFENREAILEVEKKMKGKIKQDYSVFRNVGWMIQNAWRKQKSVLWLCLILALLGVILNLVQLFIAPEILGKVEQGASIGSLLTTVGIFSGILFLVMGLKRYVRQNTILGRISVRMSIAFQLSYKSNITSYENHINAGVTRMLKKAEEALNGNQSSTEQIWTTLTNLLENGMNFLIYLFLLSNLEWWIVALVIGTGTVSFLVNRKVNQWKYENRKEEEKYIAHLDYVGRTSESVTMAKDIRIFGLQRWMQDIYTSTLNLYSAFRKRQGKVQILWGMVDVLMNVARNGIAYGYLITLTLQEGMSTSQFLLYFTAVSSFAAWILGILEEVTNLHKESLDITSVREYLELSEPFRFEGGENIPEAKAYELKAENVSFRYPEEETYIFRNLNLTVHPGEKLAIVGVNGAGKTTLIKLLSGLLNPTEGRILLNGQDIREFNRREYYGLFSAVFQEFSVPEITVEQTVAQDCAAPDRKRVKECLEKAGIMEKISTLPLGLETHIGRQVYKDGVLLSGGQMQRLMLARALYKDGKILMLDEPTAALDPIAENDIYQKYSEMTKGKTSLFISHRLASTRFCDRIIYMEQGEIEEEGNHEELLALDGKYAKLFEVQSRYYREGEEYGAGA